jgi:hypothetical protein
VVTRSLDLRSPEVGGAFSSRLGSILGENEMRTFVAGSTKIDVIGHTTQDSLKLDRSFPITR